MKYITADDRRGIEAFVVQHGKPDIRAYGHAIDFEFDLEEQGILFLHAMRDGDRHYVQSLERVELEGVPNQSWIIEIPRQAHRRQCRHKNRRGQP